MSRPCSEFLDHVVSYASGLGIGDETFRSISGNSVLLLSFSNTPITTLIRIICESEEELPVLIVDLPGAIEAFYALGPGKDREFLKRLLAASDVRGLKVLATPGGSLYVAFTPKHLSGELLGPAVESPGVLAEALVRLGALIGEWVVKAYEKAARGEEMPPPVLGQFLGTGGDE